MQLTQQWRSVQEASAWQDLHTKGNDSPLFCALICIWHGFSLHRSQSPGSLSCQVTPKSGQLPLGFGHAKLK